MKKYKWWFIGLNALIVLSLFNKSIYDKEAILDHGQLVLLKLAPVDPRSLMQGDYMSLRYEITDNLDFSKISKRGFCIVRLDANGVGSRVRIQPEIEPLAENEYALVYTTNGWSMNIGAESFFFQEGHAEKYDKAQYGAMRIDREGHNVLVGLYDEKLQKIQ